MKKPMIAAATFAMLVGLWFTQVPDQAAGPEGPTAVTEEAAHPPEQFVPVDLRATSSDEAPSQPVTPSERDAPSEGEPSAEPPDEAGSTEAGSAESTGDGGSPRSGPSSTGSPDEVGTARTEPTPGAEAVQPPALGESGDSEPRTRDLMVDDDVVAGMFESFPEFAACHRMLIELEPETLRELTFLFEISVTEDPESENGVPELLSVSAGDLELEDIACFAEVLEELKVPQPEDGQPYVSALQVSLRTELEENEGN